MCALISFEENPIQCCLWRMAENSGEPKIRHENIVDGGQIISAISAILRWTLNLQQKQRHSFSMVLC